MTHDKATSILERVGAINGKNLTSFSDGRWSGYLQWSPRESMAMLDGRFSADELEAIAVWIRHYRQAKP